MPSRIGQSFVIEFASILYLLRQRFSNASSVIFGTTGTSVLTLVFSPGVLDRAVAGLSFPASLLESSASSCMSSELNSVGRPILEADHTEDMDAAYVWRITSCSEGDAIADCHFPPTKVLKSAALSSPMRIAAVKASLY